MADFWTPNLDTKRAYPLAHHACVGVRPDVHLISKFGGEHSGKTVSQKAKEQRKSHPAWVTFGVPRFSLCQAAGLDLQSIGWALELARICDASAAGFTRISPATWKVGNLPERAWRYNVLCSMPRRSAHSVIVMADARWSSSWRMSIIDDLRGQGSRRWAIASCRESQSEHIQGRCWPVQRHSAVQLVIDIDLGVPYRVIPRHWEIPKIFFWIIEAHRARLHVFVRGQFIV